MAAAGARLRADMVRIVAGIAGLLHEDGDVFLRRDFVEHVVEQAGEDPVAARAVGDPEPAFRETKSTRQFDQLCIGRDDGVECGIGSGNREGRGRWRGSVAAHLRTCRTALRAGVRDEGENHRDRNDADTLSRNPKFHARQSTPSA